MVRSPNRRRLLVTASVIHQAMKTLSPLWGGVVRSARLFENSVTWKKRARGRTQAEGLPHHSQADPYKALATAQTGLASQNMPGVKTFKHRQICQLL